MVTFYEPLVYISLTIVKTVGWRITSVIVGGSGIFVGILGFIIVEEPKKERIVNAEEQK